MHDKLKLKKVQTNGGGSFPIVAIGTSIEGFDSVKLFFKNLPQSSGMAFVILQHLDSLNKRSNVDLEHYTDMDIYIIDDNTRINPNCVYVAPVDKDIIVQNENLFLMEPTVAHGLRMPIDTFLRSLAQTRQGLSVAVILSGIGTDGTLGIRSIKERAGLVLAQQSDGTELDGMPCSAINSGMVDIVAPPEELPGKIISFLDHATRADQPKLVYDVQTNKGMEMIVGLLCEYTSQNFSFYKNGTVYRRVERRMNVHQVRDIDAYIDFLRENPQELEVLFKELLIGVTSFFRDSLVWDKIKKEVIPKLITKYPDGRVLRAWVPGCSTGEEAYSLAMCFKEALAMTASRATYSVHIFATDFDNDAIDKARKGIYPNNIVADVSQERLNRFFVKEKDGYRICKEIREMVIFASQNVAMDPPFTNLDMLSCRNLLIYFKPELQKKLISLFYRSLNTGGILLLGSAETIGSYTDLFDQLNGELRIYQSVASNFRANMMEFSNVIFPHMPDIIEKPVKHKPAENLQSLTDKMIIKEYSPSTILVNDKGDILYITGKTGKYIEPAAGKVNWNILTMAKEGLQYKLAESFWKAIRENSTITIKKVRIKTDNGPQDIQLTIRYIEKPEAMRGMVLIIFKDLDKVSISKIPVKTQFSHNDKMTEVEQELQQTRIELQISREEMQISQEELKSKNEELQSANEEMQSMIEELTTSKEELQSLNEELHSVNAELQSKLDDLARVENDMRNLLDSTDIATVFLDDDLNIRSFTIQAAKIFNFIPRDIGRRITDITTNLNYLDLSVDVRKVLKTCNYIEKQIIADKGKWFLVRILPYRNLDNIIDGVVITLSDITAAKRLEIELRNGKISS